MMILRTPGENLTGKTPSGSCVCCTEGPEDHPLQLVPVLRTPAGAEWSTQGGLGSPARLSVLPGQTPWEGFHTNFGEAKAKQLMDEISSVLSVAVRSSLGGGFCSPAAAAALAAAAAAASCLVSKDSASDKSWEEAAGSATKSILLGVWGGGGKNSAAVKEDDSGRQRLR